MRQLLILSGKGGTGKTTIASAFIKLSEARAYADCDVDAPNLHLITEWDIDPENSDFFGLPKAKIDKDICIRCDVCREHCRFGAIKANPEYEIDLYACEGCGVCEYVCPAGAVKMTPHVAGELTLYDDGEKVFSTAELKMGSGTSGLLVSEVKKRMKSAVKDDVDFAIIDGSPGIGCPVIASLSGVDMVLIVAEPSLSGISDMERIIDTAKLFGVKIAVCVNKYDTNLKNTERIESFCRENRFPHLGRIPFDTEAVKAVNSGKTIVDIDCKSGRAVREVYKNTMEMLLE
jgi:MinD superfamily P-loop ATPase